MLELSLVNMCVLIPRYDSVGHLAKCLDSVLMEDFGGRENLGSDDCTTGNTLKVIETYSAFFCP
jgi:hypothetical protein